jgi:hypothetical protein
MLQVHQKKALQGQSNFHDYEKDGGRLVGIGKSLKDKLNCLEEYNSVSLQLENMKNFLGGLSF